MDEKKNTEVRFHNLELKKRYQRKTVKVMTPLKEAIENCGLNYASMAYALNTQGPYLRNMANGYAKTPEKVLLGVQRISRMVRLILDQSHEETAVEKQMKCEKIAARKAKEAARQARKEARAAAASEQEENEQLELGLGGGEESKTARAPESEQ